MRLAGQAAALAELRAVTRARTATRRTSKPERRRRVGLAAVVVVGALATGGVAGAATGHLPGPVREAARSILVTVGGAEPAAPTPGPAPARARGRPDPAAPTPVNKLPRRPVRPAADRPPPDPGQPLPRTWKASAGRS